MSEKLNGSEGEGMSRRTLLAMAAGGVGGLLARALAAATPAMAADGNRLVLGQSNTAESETSLTSDAPAPMETDHVLTVTAGGPATSVRGLSTDGVGVIGAATGTGVGVRGEGAQAVVGDSSGFPGPGGIGVYGITGGAGSGYGVYGQHGDSSGGTTGAGTGVYGVSYSPIGYGVFGESPNYGLLGQTDAGRGGFFIATTPKGTALETSGQVRFSSSGIDTIAAGDDRVTVTPGVDITNQSKVLCTLLSDPGGATTIQRVSRNTTLDRFTVHLTAGAASATRVGWFVIS